MKRYPASKARAQLSRLLDAAEQGEVVAIERRGVRFTLRSDEHAVRRSAKRTPVLEVLDPAVAAGEWTWSRGPQGLRFRRKRSRR